MKRKELEETLTFLLTHPDNVGMPTEIIVDRIADFVEDVAPEYGDTLLNKKINRVTKQKFFDVISSACTKSKSKIAEALVTFVNS